MNAAPILAGLLLQASPEPAAFEDPAPPVVHRLEPQAAPAAVAFEGLTTHRAPRPLSPDAAVEDWPSFLGPRRDAHSRETHLAQDFGPEGPPLLWEMATGKGFACPVIADGRLVFTHRVGDEARIVCLDPETGRRFWSRAYPCAYRGRYVENDGPRSTPVIHDGRVYVHGVEGVLHCLELSTGRVIWKRDVQAELDTPDDFFGVVSSPLVYGDTLIQHVGARGGPCVVAFDLATGRLRWGAGDAWGPSCASPVLARPGGRDTLLVIAGGESRPPSGGLLVLDPRDGRISARYPFRSRIVESVNAASPVWEGERVFLTAAYGVGSVGLRLEEDGALAELWKDRHLGIQFANPVWHDGRVYVIDGVSGRAGALVCVDPATGEVLSRTDLDWEETVVDGGVEKELSISVGEGSLLHADGAFLCLGDRGSLLWLDTSPAGAEVLSRATLFHAGQTWTPPVVAGGLLYVTQNERARFGTSGPRLLCYDLRAGE